MALMATVQVGAADIAGGDFTYYVKSGISRDT
jgi:hypothetical protein